MHGPEELRRDGSGTPPVAMATARPPALRSEVGQKGVHGWVTDPQEGFQEPSPPAREHPHERGAGHPLQSGPCAPVLCFGGGQVGREAASVTHTGGRGRRGFPTRERELGGPVGAPRPHSPEARPAAPARLHGAPPLRKLAAGVDGKSLVGDDGKSSQGDDGKRLVAGGGEGRLGRDGRPLRGNYGKGLPEKVLKEQRRVSSFFPFLVMASPFCPSFPPKKGKG